jgi:hypothetical protein
VQVSLSGYRLIDFHFGLIVGSRFRRPTCLFFYDFRVWGEIT